MESETEAGAARSKQRSGVWFIFAAQAKSFPALLRFPVRAFDVVTGNQPKHALRHFWGFPPELVAVNRVPATVHAKFTVMGRGPQ